MCAIVLSKFSNAAPPTLPSPDPRTPKHEEAIGTNTTNELIMFHQFSPPRTRQASPRRRYRWASGFFLLGVLLITRAWLADVTDGFSSFLSLELHLCFIISSPQINTDCSALTTVVSCTLRAVLSLSVWASRLGSMIPTCGLRAAPWGGGFVWRIRGM